MAVKIRWVGYRSTGLDAASISHTRVGYDELRLAASGDSDRHSFLPSASPASVSSATVTLHHEFTNTEKVFFDLVTTSDAPVLVVVGNVMCSNPKNKEKKQEYMHRRAHNFGTVVTIVFQRKYAL